MKRPFFFLLFLLYAFPLIAQESGDLVFIADIQAPTWAEKISHKKERNIEAADSLLGHLSKQNYRALFLLGDLVSLGYSDSAWERIDKFLNKTREKLIPSYAIPGNHEYFLRSEKGIKNFHHRFPYVPLTGYYKVIDSLAVIMLNSNFKKLSDEEINRQQAWYLRQMDSLNKAPGIKAIIVCCHHSPYTNSKEVGVSEEVQEKLVPAYLGTSKAVLFLSGHAHSLELFVKHDKYFMVIGGGGGVAQPMRTGDNSAFHDLINAENKPRFFYLVVKQSGNELQLSASGFQTNNFEKIRSYSVLKLPLIEK